MEVVDGCFFVWLPSVNDLGVWTRLYEKCKKSPSFSHSWVFKRAVGKSMIRMFSEQTRLLHDYSLQDYKVQTEGITSRKSVLVEYYWPPFNELSVKERLSQVAKTQEAIQDETEQRQRVSYIPFLDISLSVEQNLPILNYIEENNIKGVNYSIMWHEHQKVFSCPYSVKNMVLAESVEENLAYLSKSNLLFEISYYQHQHLEVDYLVNRHKELIFVCSNCGGVTSYQHFASDKKEMFRNWEISIRNLAQYNNVFIKVCGLLAPSLNLKFSKNSTPVEVSALLKPYLNVVLNAFGSERCLFGTGLPIEGKLPIVTLVEAFVVCLRELGCDESAIQAIMKQNAVRLYNLKRKT